MKSLRLLLWCLVLGAWSFALVGCLSDPTPGTTHWYAPSTWGKSTEATKLDKALQAESKATAPLLQAARIAAHETTIALASAPPSQPVEVAQHSAGQAATLLDQLTGPLTAQDASDLKNRLSALLSQEAATRAQAEKARDARDRDLARLSEDYARREAATTKAQADLREAFDREHGVAQAYRTLQSKWWIAALTIGTLWLLPIFAHLFPGLAPLNWIAGLLNPPLAWAAQRARAGLQSIGQTLAEAKPEEREATITLIDPLLDRDHQKIIRHARAQASGGYIPILPSTPPPRPT